MSRSQRDAILRRMAVEQPRFPFAERILAQVGIRLVQLAP